MTKPTYAWIRSSFAHRPLRLHAYPLFYRRYRASIDLVSPDPGATPLPESRRSTVSSDTGSVTFTPDQVRPESLTGTRAPAELKIEPGDMRPEGTERTTERPREARATVQKVEL